MRSRSGVSFPGDYADTARSAAFAAFGIANFYFYGHTGYFDTAAEFVPLLHLWSLGVEEQFYVAWPAILFGISYWLRQRRDRIALVIIVLIVGSFATSLFTLKSDPKAAFYFPHTRAWELALGGLLVFLPPLPKRIAEPAIIGGLALIATGFLIISDKQPFPGWNALLPCLGSALVIWPKSKTWCSQVLAYGRPIGLISYSLYLWHWPIWVLYRIYINNRVPTLWEATLLAFASIAMATASLFLIERPFRRMRANRFAVIGIGAISAATTALLAIWISRSEGFPNRIPQKFLAMKSFEEMWRWKCPQRGIFSTLVPVCAFGVDWDSAKIKGVLWGDSHASHFAPLLEPFARDAKASILLYDTCPAIVDGVRFSENYPNLPPTYSSACGDYRRAMLRTLDEHPEITLVILASSWVYLPGLLYRSDLKAGEHKSGIELFENALEATIADIQRPGRRIVLIDRFLSGDLTLSPANYRPPLWSGPRVRRQHSLVRRATTLSNPRSECWRALPPAILIQSLSCPQIPCAKAVHAC